ncbi:MAG: hypothetical protein P8Q97_02160 [Myxococcota bacterium]|nr:hypothetical protein [Myxococcota bacterium]
MLLRASSEAIGEEAELDAAVGHGDGGVPHGGLLIAFAEAATRGSEELAEVRGQLLAAAGEEALVQAAATVGSFNGLVRVADSIGIPLDEGTRVGSGEFRERLGLNNFGGSRNTNLDVGDDETAQTHALQDLLGR